MEVFAIGVEESTSLHVKKEIFMLYQQNVAQVLSWCNKRFALSQC